MMGAVAGSMGMSQPQKSPQGPSGDGGLNMPQPQIDPGRETSGVSEVRERRMEAVESFMQSNGATGNQQEGLLSAGEGSNALSNSDPSGRLGSNLDLLA